MKRQLIIESKDLSKKINKFLDKVSKSDASLEKFAKNPTFDILSDIVPDINDKMSKSQISDSNKLLFSILSNDKFRKWIITYQKTVSESIDNPINKNKTLDEILPREKVLEDLSQAIIEFGDKEIFKSVLRAADNSMPNAGTFVVTDDIAIVTIAVVALVVLVTAIDVTPRTLDSKFELILDAQKIRSIADTMVNKAKLERKLKNL
jgi:hypothetical protein